MVGFKELVQSWQILSLSALVYVVFLSLLVDGSRLKCQVQNSVDKHGHTKKTPSHPQRGL